LICGQGGRIISPGEAQSLSPFALAVLTTSSASASVVVIDFWT